MTVLQDMTKGLMTTKATKAARLTPVAGESSTTVAQMAAALAIPDVPEVFLTNEAVADIAKDLRRQAALLIEVADALDKRTGVPSERFDVKAVAQAAVKQAEAEADARAAAEEPTPNAAVLPEVSLDDESVANVDPRAYDDDEEPEEEPFSARMKRLTAEAQASVFKAADDDGTAAEPVAPAEAGWTCPDHPGVQPTIVTPRKGNPYRMCGNDACERYEK